MGVSAGKQYGWCIQCCACTELDPGLKEKPARSFRFKSPAAIQSQGPAADSRTDFCFLKLF